MSDNTTDTNVANDVHASVEEAWYLKEITFKPEPDSPPKRFKIITQNFNG